MGRRGDENHSTQKISQFKTQREMKKMDTQFLTPAKQ
jgi:hypothetical protein